MSLLDRIRISVFSKGGVHPPYRKFTATMKTTPGPEPDSVVIPLQQHIGTPCEPLVEIGERVLVGQKIGDADAYVSAPVHSSVSGEVTGIIKHPHPLGQDAVSILVESDGQNELSPGVKPYQDPMVMPPEQIRKAVREGGIVGLGGASFPTHVKLSPPRDRPIRTLIVNGAECEPYLSGDNRLMVERAEAILKGARIVQRAVGAEELFVAVESNKPDAIRVMQEAGAEYGARVVTLPTSYPQGAEKILIRDIKGVEVPSGGLPMGVGVIVDNVGTLAAIHDLFYKGMPLVERVVTVGGDGVSGHANLITRIGTRFRDVIDFCGGLVGEPGKVIMGGPMMGLAQYTLDVPVVKATTGIIVFRGETVFKKEPAQFVCIRCSRCVRKCPMSLMPYLLGSYSEAGLWAELEPLNIDDCIECGCCAYTCLTKNPLVQLIKVGKEGLARAKKRSETLAGDMWED